MFEDFSDFIDLDFQHLVPHPERMVCNIAQPLKNANLENKKTEKRTMGSVDVADFFAALLEDGMRDTNGSGGKC